MKKFVVGGIVMVLVTCGWSTMSVGEQKPAPRGELRIVDKNPANWAWITYNIFETLIEVDLDGKLVPKLATGWRWLDERTLEVTLRQGVKFHNGEVFDASSFLNQTVQLWPGSASCIWGVASFIVSWGGVKGIGE